MSDELTDIVCPNCANKTVGNVKYIAGRKEGFLTKCSTCKLQGPLALSVEEAVKVFKSIVVSHTPVRFTIDSTSSNGGSVCLSYVPGKLTMFLGSAIVTTDTAGIAALKNYLNNLVLPDVRV